MRELSLQARPNQNFTASVGDAAWDIELKACDTYMAVSLWRNGELIIQGQRIVAREPFIPYRHLSINGNFVIFGDNDDDPDWRKFGESQQLFFFEPGEL